MPFSAMKIQLLCVFNNLFAWDCILNFLCMHYIASWDTCTKLLTLKSLYRYRGAYLKQMSFSLLGVKPPQWQGRWWSGVSHGPPCIAGQIHSDEHWSPGGSSERTTGGLCLDETIFCLTLSAVTALLVNTSSCKHVHHALNNTLHTYNNHTSPSSKHPPPF